MFVYFLILLFSIITKYNFNLCAATLSPGNTPYYNLKFVMAYIFEQIIEFTEGRTYKLNSLFLCCLLHPSSGKLLFCSLNLRFLGIIRSNCDYFTAGIGRLNCYLLNRFIIDIFDAFVTFQALFRLGQ